MLSDDPIELIRRAHKAGVLTDAELQSEQDKLAPRCSVHTDVPAKVRIGAQLLCEACATLERLEAVARRLPPAARPKVGYDV